MIIGQIFLILFLCLILLFMAYGILMMCGIDVYDSFSDGKKYIDKQDPKKRYPWEGDTSQKIKEDYADKDFLSQHFFVLGIEHQKNKKDRDKVRAERLEKLLDKHE